MILLLEKRNILSVRKYLAKIKLIPMHTITQKVLARQTSIATNAG